MKAVVLAAGKGTRMEEITDEIPKPMVEVGGRPMLWHVLSSLRAAGVTEAAVIVGYMGEAIRSYFRDDNEVGVRLIYFVQEVQDGTGRAADPARGFLGDGPFFHTFGDILAPVSVYKEMALGFADAPSDLIMAVRRVEDPHRGGAVYLEGDRVTAIVEKPEPGSSTTNWMNAGILIATRVLFDYTSRLVLSPRGEYELPDACRMMIDDGRDIRAFRLEGYWRDVGTPEDARAADRDMRDGRGGVGS